LLVGAALAAALAAAGCAGDSTGVRVPNVPPSLRLTAGPIEDSLHVYRVTFHWTAEDPDGELVAYEHAIDGDTTAADTLVTTLEPFAALRFTADDFVDVVVENVGGVPTELYRFGRHHTFHVRAVDDAGARSPFVSAAFFAVTVAPSTRIINPDPRNVGTVGHSFAISWEGEDLDGSGPPALYTTRIVPVPEDSLTMIGVERLDCEGCAPPWSPFSPGTGVRYDRLEAGAYLFGVRAQDEAGAVEPELEFLRNALRLRVSGEPGRPTVRLTALGKTVELPLPETTPPDEADSLRTFDMASGQVVGIAWEADASAYGASVTGYSYGLDLESTAPDAPGWVPLGAPAVTVVLHNPEGVDESVHLFYLQVRDSIDQVSVYDVILRVGPPDFQFDILYVDDIGDGDQGSPSNPSDAERDRLVLDHLLAEAGRRGMTVDQYEVQDNRGVVIPGAPELQRLRKYKLLVWTMGSPQCAFALAMDYGGDLPLHQYLDLGGMLWITGKQVMTRSIFGITDEYFGFTEGDFGWDYFHIETQVDGGEIVQGEFLRPRSNAADQRIDGLDGAHPTPAAAAEGWPELLVSREPYTGQLFGIPLVEGMTKGYQHGFRPGVFDTLYTTITNGSRWQPIPIPSRLDDAPSAFRYAGPGHGRTMVFAFPLFWFSDGALDSVGTRAIEWFFDGSP
jgi:hypothetical protein